MTIIGRSEETRGKGVVACPQDCQAGGSVIPCSDVSAVEFSIPRMSVRVACRTIPKTSAENDCKYQLNCASNMVIYQTSFESVVPVLRQPDLYRNAAIQSHPRRFYDGSDYNAR